MGTDESPQQDGAAATPAASPSGSTTDIIQGKKQLARAMMEARRTLDDRDIEVVVIRPGAVRSALFGRRRGGGGFAFGGGVVIREMDGDVVDGMGDVVDSDPTDVVRRVDFDANDRG